MKRDELLAAAKEYSRMANQWFRDGGTALRAKEHEILAQAKLNAPGLKESVLDLTGLVRELRLHQDRIHDQLRDSFSADASPDAASLQVALATIDRSIADWVRLKEIFSENEDALLDILVHLDRLRRALRQPPPP